MRKLLAISLLVTFATTSVFAIEDEDLKSTVSVNEELEAKLNEMIDMNNQMNMTIQALDEKLSKVLEEQKQEKVCNSQNRYLQ